MIIYIQGKSFHTRGRARLTEKEYASSNTYIRQHIIPNGMSYFCNNFLNQW